MTASYGAHSAKNVVPWNATAKRFVDTFASFAGLVVLAPVFIGIAIAITLDDRGPIFFRQKRVGRSGRLFLITKFRTMKAAVEDKQMSLSAAGDPRITRVGAFLRKTKLDELPQLFDVLKGNMSLVGPRPETPDLFSYYTPDQRAVMQSVRPGMTDYASLLLKDEAGILARTSDPMKLYHTILIPFKVELAARYVEDIGMATDVQIIFATIWSIIFPLGQIPLINKAIVELWVRTVGDIDHVV